MELRSLISLKTIRFIVITVLLGAIGSGAWEWILKPFITGASEFGLNIATLGIRSFKDSLYQDIGRGLHEESSLRVFTAIFAFVPCFILGAITGTLAARRRNRNGEETSRLERAVDKIAQPMLILSIFILVFSVVQANQHVYVNRAVTHFNQLLVIAGPYMDEETRILYRSNFAQISSSDDYAKLIGNLEKICRENKLKTPRFAVW